MEDGAEVKNAIVTLQEREYDDDLYEGVPESAIERQVGEDVASTGIEWLERIGDIQRASDGSVAIAE